MSTSSGVDVLVMTALIDELEALCAVDGAQWTVEKDATGHRLHRRRLGSVPIAAAWVGEMGRTSTATRATDLVLRLDPTVLAMCGICAGNPSDVSLGDVIVADRIYSYDPGKVVVRQRGAQRDEQFFPDITTYNLDHAWRNHVGYFARPGPFHEAMTRSRPLSRAWQASWLLHRIDDHTRGAGPAPECHPERPSHCPGWTTVLGDLTTSKFVRPGPPLALTAKGKLRVREDRIKHPDGYPNDPPFRVHMGVIATGEIVQKDPGIFNRLERLNRKTLGIEMEAAAIGHVAQHFGRKAIVVKAVSDYGDLRKDDSFRKFAAGAAAETLLRLLEQFFAPPNAGLGVDATATHSSLKNPFKTGGTLTPGHPTYVVRACDEEMTAALRTKPLIAVEGAYMIGKSSLVLRAKADLAKEHPTCYVDLSKHRTDEVSLLLGSIFRKFSDELGRKVNDWPELLPPGAPPLTLIFDEVGALESHTVVNQLFTPLVNHALSPSPQLSVVVCLPVYGEIHSIQDFLKSKGVTNPKYRNSWHRIGVPRFGQADIESLLRWLPARVQALARANVSELTALSNGLPVAVQRVCSALYDADITGTSDARLLEILVDPEAYK